MKQDNNQKKTIENSAVVDLLVIGVIIFASLYLSSALDMHEKFMDFVEQHERWELDELLFGGVLCISLCFIWYIWRRLEEFKRYLDVIQESRSRYQSLVDSTNDAIYLVNKDCEYLFMNKEIINVLQADENNYVGTSYSDYYKPEETAIFKRHIESIFSKGMSEQHEFRSLTSGRYLLQTYSPVVTASNRIIAVTVISKDISKRKSMEEELRALSLSDKLTGLYNRRGFEEFAEKYLKISKRQNRGIYILYADMDNLKIINDKFGHSAGDNAIKQVASILVENFRESDFVARLGGDEFVVMPAGYEGDNVQVINARLQKSIDEHNLQSQDIFKLSLSVGVSYFDPNMPKALDELLEDADKLMYKSKQLKNSRLLSF